jgi:hypothetical protein
MLKTQVLYPDIACAIPKFFEIGGPVKSVRENSFSGNPVRRSPANFEPGAWPLRLSAR